jgi:hypothetical protein
MDKLFTKEELVNGTLDKNNKDYVLLDPMKINIIKGNLRHYSFKVLLYFLFKLCIFTTWKALSNLVIVGLQLKIQ